MRYFGLFLVATLPIVARGDGHRERMATEIFNPVTFAVDDPAKEPLRCPVTGKPVDVTSVYASFLGKKVYFADENARKAFGKDFGPYLYEAYLQLLLTKQMLKAACPIRGDPLSDEYKARFRGFEFGFCCDDCVHTFKQAGDAEKFWLVFAHPNKGFTLQADCPVTKKPIALDPPLFVWTEKKVNQKNEKEKPIIVKVKVWFADAASKAAFQKTPQQYVAALPEAFPELDDTRPMTRHRLAYAAYSLLKNKCISCHNKNHVGGADFQNIDNINPQRVWDYVRKDRMPLDKCITYEDKSLLLEWKTRGAPGVQDHKDTIKWGAPTPFMMSEYRNTTFVAEENMLHWMCKYLENKAEKDRKYFRFFTLVHLHNDFDGVTERQMRLYRAAVSKMVNSLSNRNNDIKRPEIVDKGDFESNSLLAIDLRSYDWDDNSWNKILNEYPYGLDYTRHSNKKATALAQQLVSLTKTTLPFVRGDWFVAIASQAPLYHILVDTPLTLGELDERMLPEEYLLRKDERTAKGALNFVRAIRDKRIMRMATDSGLTTYQNRLVERCETKSDVVKDKNANSRQKYYYRSYDFDPNEPKSNLVEFPLGPRFKGNQFSGLVFKHGGGEIIYSLPNGLQAYMVVDDQGRRQDTGAIRLLKDPLDPPTANSPALANALSCIGCHRRGLNTVTFSNEDFVKPAWKDRLGHPAKQTIDGLYSDQETFEKRQRGERALFEQAVKEATGSFLLKGNDVKLEIFEFPEPVRALSLKFYEYLGLKQVALELGIPPEDGRDQLETADFGKLRKSIQRLIGEKPALSRLGMLQIPYEVKKAAPDDPAVVKVRGLQRINFGIRRGLDVTHFQILARELGRGTPFWRRFHRQPIDVPDAIAQLAYEIAGFLSQEQDVGDIKVAVKATVKKQEERKDLFATALAERFQGVQLLFEQELQRNKVLIATHGDARYEVALQFEAIKLLQMKINAEITDVKGTNPLYRVSFSRSLNTDSKQGWTLQESGLLSFLGSAALFSSKDDTDDRWEKVLVGLKRGSVITASTQARATKSGGFAIEILALDGKKPSTFAPVKLEPGPMGVSVPLAKDQVYRVKLINDTDQEVAVQLTIDGLSMFAFSPEWNEAAIDDRVRPPSYVLLPARGVRIIEGWYRDPLFSDQFQIGAIAGHPRTSRRLGVISAAFLPTFQDPSASRFAPSGLLKPGEQPITHRGEEQVNDRTFLRVERFIGRCLEVISVRYAVE